MKWHGKSRRKPTGGSLRPHRKKKKRELGGEFLFPEIGEPKRKVFESGGGRKVKIIRDNTANVSDPGTGEMKRALILGVDENPANPHYARRNVITKGSTIRTEVGKARVTSRPGQDGVVNATLITDS